MVELKINTTEVAKAIFWFLLITSIYVLKGSIESASNPKDSLGNQKTVSHVLQQDLPIYLTVLLSPLIYKLLVAIEQYAFPMVSKSDYGFGFGLALNQEDISNTGNPYP